jgi:dihydrofolate reductase
VHRLVNELERPIGTHLYGRRMYEVMVAWEHPETFAGGQPVLQDFARVWQAADKVVYSTTLDAPSSARTRIEREFDPEAVRRLKEQSARDVGIGGPGLAAHAIRAGLVDEWQLFLTPITVGAASPPCRRALEWSSS